MHSNDVRGAVVDEMRLRASEFHLHPDAIQFFAGNTKNVQVKHYQALGGDGFVVLQK